MRRTDRSSHLAEATRRRPFSRWSARSGSARQMTWTLLARGDAVRAGQSVWRAGGDGARARRRWPTRPHRATRSWRAGRGLAEVAERLGSHGRGMNPGPLMLGESPRIRRRNVDNVVPMAAAMIRKRCVAVVGRAVARCSPASRMPPAAAARAAIHTCCANYEAEFAPPCATTSCCATRCPMRRRASRRRYLRRASVLLPPCRSTSPPAASHSTRRPRARASTGSRASVACTQLEITPLFERLQDTCAAVFSGTVPPGGVCFFDEEVYRLLTDAV